MCWAGICLALAVVLSVAAARGRPFAGDVEIALATQAVGGEKIVGAAHLFSWLGLFVPSLVVGLAAAGWLWRAGARRGALVVAVAALAHPLNGLLKLAVDRPRPSVDEVAILEQASGLGFPSGHAFGAMLLFGTLAGVALRTGVKSTGRAPGVVLAAGCLVVALLIGWSRVKLGAHWPSDVLGGWLWGGGLALLLLSSTSGSEAPGDRTSVGPRPS